MWASNFKRINEEYKSILPENTQTQYNGRVNIIDTSKENMEKRISLFEKTEPRKKITDYRDATAHILQESKLSYMFFSVKNIEYIQQQLKNAIYKKSNGKYKLLPQNQDNLKVIMRAYYLQYSYNDVGNEVAEMNYLNGLVLDYLIPYIMKESIAYDKYLRDQSTLVMPFDRSIQVDRDFKGLEYTNFLYDWIHQPMNT